MSRMPLVKHLVFDDKPLHQGRDLWNPPVRPSVDVRDAYYRVMSIGMAGRQTWTSCQPLFMQSTLYPTLVQLTIAVHQLGISLISVKINLEGIHSDNVLNADPATLRSLSSAFKSLKQVAFYGCPVLMGYGPSPTGFKALSAYLAQMLTSPQLQEMSIDTCGSSQGHYGKDPIWYPEDLWERLPASILSLSSKISRTSLLHVSLCRVEFHCADLFAFIASLPMSMERLQLDQVELLDGTWEGVLDELRMKVYHSNLGYALLNHLTGGEFRPMGHAQIKRLLGNRQPEGDSSVSFVNGYCLRYHSINPFKAMREGIWTDLVIGLYMTHDFTQGDLDMFYQDGKFRVVQTSKGDEDGEDDEEENMDDDEQEE